VGSGFAIKLRPVSFPLFWLEGSQLPADKIPVSHAASRARSDSLCSGRWRAFASPRARTPPPDGASRPGRPAAQHPRWLVPRRRKGQGSEPARYRWVELCQPGHTAPVLQRHAAWPVFGVRRDAAPGAHERARPCVEGACQGVGLRVFVSLRDECFAVDGRRRPRATRLWRGALKTLPPVTRRITP